MSALISETCIYWAIEKNAKKVYAFEPLKSTYEILLKNTEINDLQDVVIPYNFGLSDEDINAKVTVFNASNIGGTHFTKDKNGHFQLKQLDSIDIPEKIDLIKIDVEGHEVETLMGAIQTIRKNKPVITIETFNHQKEVNTIFYELGYELVKTIRENADYIYKYTGE